MADLSFSLNSSPSLSSSLPASSQDDFLTQFPASSAAHHEPILAIKNLNVCFLALIRPYEAGANKEDTEW